MWPWLKNMTGRFVWAGPGRAVPPKGGLARTFLSVLASPPGARTELGHFNNAARAYRRAPSRCPPLAGVLRMRQAEENVRAARRSTWQ